MELRYKKGDELSFKEYLLNIGNPVRFTRIGKWFVFSTLEAIIVTALLVLVMNLFSLFAGTLPKDITKILKLSSYFVLLCMACVWLISFYTSFIIPQILKRRIPGFVKKYIPDAENLEQFNTDVWFFSRRGRCYSVALKTNGVKVYGKYSSGGKFSRYYKISTASSFGDYQDWEMEYKEVPLLEGITIVYTNVNVFARIKPGKKYFPKDIAEALDALSKHEKLIFGTGR